jgi:hypothetical protein
VLEVQRTDALRRGDRLGEFYRARRERDRDIANGRPPIFVIGAREANA